MSIIENGVAVLPVPRQMWWGAVQIPSEQSGGILSAPILNTGSGGWFAAVVGKMLRIYHPPRLWTTPTDSTDPGYTWGIHWALGIRVGDEAEASIIASPYIDGAQIKLRDTLANNDPICQFIPTPGVPEYISLQQMTYLTVALILADSVANQSVVCPVQLTLCDSWST